MPNPWVFAALAGFSVVALIVYLAELDQPPLAPPHYQHHRSRDSHGARDRDGGSNKKNDDASTSSSGNTSDDDHDQHERHRDATTVTSGAHRFPGSAGSGSMTMRRRSRTASSGSRQGGQQQIPPGLTRLDTPRQVAMLSTPNPLPDTPPPPPAYDDALAATGTEMESAIELQPLQSSYSLASNASSSSSVSLPVAPPLGEPSAAHHSEDEALALASELEATERQLQELLVKREQLALRQSQIDLRQLAAQAAAVTHLPPQESHAGSSLDVDEAAHPFRDDGDANELDKVGSLGDADALSESGSDGSGSLISVPALGPAVERESNEAASLSSSGFDSSSESGCSASTFGTDDNQHGVAATATLSKAEEHTRELVPEDADMRSESEFSLVSAGSA